MINELRNRLLPDYNRVTQLLSSGELPLIEEALEVIQRGAVNPERALAQLLVIAGSRAQYGTIADSALQLIVNSTLTIIAGLIMALRSSDASAVCGAVRALSLLQAASPSDSSLLTVAQLQNIALALARAERKLGATNPTLVSAIEQWRKTQKASPAPEEKALTQSDCCVCLDMLSACGLGFDAGREVVQQKGTIILGMSIGNGRFNAQRVKQLLLWTNEKFSQVILMITDYPGLYNRLALGESEHDAVAYCRKKGAQLRSYAVAADTSNWRIWNWLLTYESAEFIRAREELSALLQSSKPFRTDCYAQTASVLRKLIAEERKLPEEGVVITERQVTLATHYIIDELAAIVAAPRLLHCTQIAYAYYENWLPYQKFICGEYGNTPHPELGFVRYRFS